MYSRFTRQLSNELRRQLSIELKWQLPENFQEVGESHRAPRQVESQSLPPNMREDGTSTNFNGERSNPIRTMAPRRVYASTTP